MRYNRSVRHQVLPTGEVVSWLETCHPQPSERAAVVARFRFVFALLREFGPAIGHPHVDRIAGYDNLWEVRVQHRTGAYRAFFGLSGTGAVILVATGASKKRDRFPPAVYRRAEQRVREAVERWQREGGNEGGPAGFVAAP